MDTHLLKVNAQKPEPEVIAQAAKIIKEGGLVAFPTETVYGLGANGLDSVAVAKIFSAKGRPGDNPLILHVADLKDVFYLASTVPLKAQLLMEAFWPGPLTLVLPSRTVIPREVTAGLDTVAIRMPDHPVALALIKAAKCPLAAPSANRSGYPSPTTTSHVMDDLAGRIEAVLDGGTTGVGLESTVLDLTEVLPTVLRPGGVTREQIAGVIGQVRLDPGLKNSAALPKAPGMKYTHYSPQAEVILLRGEPELVAAKATELLHLNYEKNLKTALLLSSETWPLVNKAKAVYAREMGSHNALGEVAHKLYHELRMCDQVGGQVILVEGYGEEGLGEALMNRLLKSAGYKLINC